MLCPKTSFRAAMLCRKTWGSWSSLMVMWLTTVSKLRSCLLPLPGSDFILALCYGVTLKSSK